MLINRLHSMSLSKKMMASFTVISALAVIIGVFAIISLNRINSINKSIIEVESQIVTIADSMIDSILAMELHAKRYEILKTADALSLYNDRAAEFRSLSKRAIMLDESRQADIDIITGSLDAMDAHHKKIFAAKSRKASRSDEEMHKHLLDDLLSKIDALKRGAHVAKDQKTAQVVSVGFSAFWVSVGLSTLALLASVVFAGFLLRDIYSSLNKLKDATEEISKNNFDAIQVLDRDDELGNLSRAIYDMASKIRQLEEMYLDASPLTRLPGGIAIQNVLKKRIEGNQPMAFCFIDMDHFKAYNDYYGYARGSDLILATSKLLERAVKLHGSTDCFLGHIGGDDFAIITTPYVVKGLCSYITKEFDAMAQQMYDEEDRKRGYIRSKNRQGEEMDFPIITISIAVVTNQLRKLSGPVEVGEIAAELKEYAKSIKGSVYVVDKRREDVNRPTY